MFWNVLSSIIWFIPQPLNLAGYSHACLRCGWRHKWSVRHKCLLRGLLRASLFYSMHGSEAPCVCLDDCDMYTLIHDIWLLWYYRPYQLRKKKKMPKVHKTPVYQYIFQTKIHTFETQPIFRTLDTFKLHDQSLAIWISITEYTPQIICTHRNVLPVVAARSPCNFAYK